MTIALRMVQGLLFTSTAVMCLLTFAWPLAVPADPAHPGFKVAAIATFVVFLVSLAVLLASRLARGS